MIPSCKNCRYYERNHKDKYISSDKLKYEAVYVCSKDMLYKAPDTLCSNWEHKNKIIRRLWRYFHE